MSDLEHLHSILLILADELDRVCKENDIKYSLTGGSMLGAVRHQGFIPWDDDMDIALTRDNYEKLLLCADKFKSDFFLQTNMSDVNYYYGYSKLLLRETVTIENGHENTKYQKGIFIDIFPLDNVPNNSKMRRKQRMTNYFLQKILRQKMSISANPEWGIKEKIIFKILGILACFLNGSKLVTKLNKNMRLVENQESKYITNLCGMYGYDKEIAEKRWFLQYENIQFEDRKYMVIKNHIDYLTKIYGNFMQIPPVEKRHTHEFQTIEFGRY